MVAGRVELSAVARAAQRAGALPDNATAAVGSAVKRPGAAATPSARRLLGPPSNVWWLNAMLAAGALLVWTFAIRGHHQTTPTLGVPWWCLGALFFLGEAWVLHVHFGRSAYSFSLTEICYVLGLLFLDPNQLLITQVAGIGLALVVVRRQSLLKLVFNLAHFTLETCVAIVVFRALNGTSDPAALHSWTAIFAAGAIVSAMGVASIIAAISLSEGDFGLTRWRGLVVFTIMGALANTSLGLLAAVLIRDRPVSTLLLTLPAALLGVAYRAQMRERRRHERMEFLYEAGRLMSRSTEMDTTVIDVLRHTRASLRAETAELLLFSTDDGAQALRTVVRSDHTETVLRPVLVDTVESALLTHLGDQRGRLLHMRSADVDALAFLGAREASDAMVCALVGETRVIGAVIIAGRLGGVATFDREDLRQLEALAAQLSIWLQNGQLERSLARLHGAPAGAGAPGIPRPADRPRQSCALPSACPHAIERAAREKRPVARCSSTSTTSRTSTTAWGTRQVTRCWLRWPTGCSSCFALFDTAVCLGGDEFAVLLETTAREADASASPSVRRGDRRADDPRRRHVVMPGSVGIATAIGDSITAEEMLRNADMAMYKAKSMGQAGWEMFGRRDARGCAGASARE